MIDSAIHHENEGERLAHELAQLAARIPTNKMLSRIRFAVTPLEYQQIELYALKHEGFSVGMIKGVRLVVEENPEDGSMKVALA